MLGTRKATFITTLSVTTAKNKVKFLAAILFMVNFSKRLILFAGATFIMMVSYCYASHY